MSAELEKLKINAASTISGGINVSTTTNVTVSIQRFFANGIALSLGTTTIQATSFKNDNGVTLSANGLPSPPTNGYYNAYLNGILQPAGNVTLTNSSLVITGTVLTLSTSAQLEVVSFGGSSTSTATNNLSVSTTLTT
ncbi:DUF4183 domain-containing protein [Priestia taiwanensis]|uniref:DUF4183 domain-containing protein n=1 Tax=Priestia taiwanensis TaxID=1347902 RepID=A0A917AT19_9BACI|nr:DUF4183 domain-containing protein [Priestia taiwanensis]MBM7363147.1 hypothetical protein [Priestia taiwanensis]GGE68084.1 hypothetical protein GCM10007140_17670 [Priestia taiwanensis]